MTGLLQLLSGVKVVGIRIQAGAKTASLSSIRYSLQKARFLLIDVRFTDSSLHLRQPRTKMDQPPHQSPKRPKVVKTRTAIQLQSIQASGISQVDLAWLQEVQEKLNAALSQPELNSTQLAQALHLSERQMRRKLKALTGLTPAKYLREARLDKSREWLKEGKYATIKETAYAAGFKDARYFAKQFQQRFGVLPSQYH